MSHHVFGVRHHGPGSARSLVAALDGLTPDCVLVEGPPDADPVLPLASHQDMAPPVALLVYPPEDPGRGVYYPFAEFSPEWQAIRWALAHEVPVRFMDLPLATQLAINIPRGDEDLVPQADPMQQVAAAAGAPDAEAWWRHMVEERPNTAEVFDGILEVMTAVRETAGPTAASDRDRLREAHMRRQIRDALRQHQTVAVVCGAWHAPSLHTLTSELGDERVLSRLPSVEVAATWVPWSHDRLAVARGYAAGLEAPGWYMHLWDHPDQVVERWMTRVARVLRQRGLDVSSAQVIDATRLAWTLAALRRRPAPGLEEVDEATVATLLDGDPRLNDAVIDQLIVGHALGTVPAATPSVPVLADVERLQRKLRMKPEGDSRTLTLDLRRDVDRARSRLLRQLTLLDVPWGVGGDRGAGRGTFKEEWTLRWRPELTVALIEAGRWGSTVTAAASRKVLATLDAAPDLPALIERVASAMYAGLDDTLDAIMQRIRDTAAVAHDVTEMMRAITTLGELLRYGDVRGTDAEALDPIVTGLIERACIGLPAAVAGLNEEACEDLYPLMTGVHATIGQLDRADVHDAWIDALSRVIRRPATPPLSQGHCCRLLLDGGGITEADATLQLELTLSPATPPAHAAAWIDGFLRESGATLIHDDDLRGLLDAWLCDLTDGAFVASLPILRRTFATFSVPERRLLSRRLLAPPVTADAPEDLDHPQAAEALALACRYLGLELP